MFVVKAVGLFVGSFTLPFKIGRTGNNTSPPIFQQLTVHFPFQNRFQSAQMHFKLIIFALLIIKLKPVWYNTKSSKYNNRFIGIVVIYNDGGFHCWRNVT